MNKLISPENVSCCFSHLLSILNFISINAMFWIIFAFFVVDCTNSEVVVEYHINRKMCTYFEGGNRFSGVEYGLVNCSWYASDCCCKRTEVTSVFSTMFPLVGATQDCKNQMNYLMCYFCDPNQHRWYNKKAKVCADFCRMIYTNCKDAEYEGRKIGEYRNGSAFCEAQNFEIVESKSNCFNFDPTVFGQAAITHPVPLLTCIIYLLSIVYALLS